MLNPGMPATQPEWFYSLRRFKSNHHVNVSQARLVWRVAPGSPAASLGLLPGDALISVNGVRANGLDIEELLLSGVDMRYRFYLVKQRAYLEVGMPPIPLGLKLLVSAQSIVETYRKNGFYGADGIMNLWEREDYQNLQKIANVLGQEATSGFLPKWLARKHREPLAALLREICAFEAQANAPDMPVLNGFVKNEMENYPPDVQALAWYYMSRLAKHNADLMYTQEYMQLAYKLNPDSERLSRAAINIGAKTHSLHPMLGRLIPDHYSLKRLGLNGTWGEETNLPELVEHMSPGQLMPLCFMPARRENPAYEQALKVYRTMSDQMGTRFAPMLVITNQVEDMELSAQEKRVAADGLPLHIVLEESGNFVSDLDVHHAPTFWAINKSRRIVWTDGLSDDFDYWSLLASVEGSNEALYENPEGTGAFGVGDVF